MPKKRVTNKLQLAVVQGALLAAASLLFVYVTVIMTFRTGISCVENAQHLTDGDTETSVSLFDYWNTILYVTTMIPVVGMSLIVSGSQRSALTVCLFFAALSFFRYISIALLSSATHTTVFVVIPNTTGWSPPVRGVFTVALARVLMDLLESSRWYHIPAGDPIRFDGWYRPVWIDHFVVPALRIVGAIATFFFAYRQTPFAMACTTFSAQEAPSSVSIFLAMSIWALSFAVVFASVRWGTFLRRIARGWRMCWPLCDVARYSFVGPHYESAVASDTDEEKTPVHIARNTGIYTTEDHVLMTIVSEPRRRRKRRRRATSLFAHFQSSGGVTNTILLLGLLLSTADSPFTSLGIVAMAILWALHIRIFPLTCLGYCRPRRRTNDSSDDMRETRSATVPSLETSAGQRLLGTIHTTFAGGNTSDSSEQGARVDSFGEENEDVAERA